MSNEIITPKNVERKTWTKEGVHDFDIRLKESQVILISNALKEMVKTLRSSTVGPEGAVLLCMADEADDLHYFFDKILKVRYSTP